MLSVLSLCLVAAATADQEPTVLVVVRTSRKFHEDRMRWVLDTWASDLGFPPTPTAAATSVSDAPPTDAPQTPEPSADSGKTVVGGPEGADLQQPEGAAIDGGDDGDEDFAAEDDSVVAGDVDRDDAESAEAQSVNNLIGWATDLEAGMHQAAAEAELERVAARHKKKAHEAVEDVTRQLRAKYRRKRGRVTDSSKEEEEKLVAADEETTAVKEEDPLAISTATMEVDRSHHSSSSSSSRSRRGHQHESVNNVAAKLRAKYRRKRGRVTTDLERGEETAKPGAVDLIIFSDDATSFGPGRTVIKLDCPDDHRKGLVCKAGKFMSYIQKFYTRHYQWFFVVDDDTYVHPQNLLKSVKQWNPTEAKIYSISGCKAQTCSGICGGGGYLVSQAALQNMPQQEKMEAAVAEWGPKCEDWDDMSMSMIAKEAGVELQQFTGLHPWNFKTLTEFNQGKGIEQETAVCLHYIRSKENMVALHKHFQERDQSAMDLYYKEHPKTTDLSKQQHRSSMGASADYFLHSLVSNKDKATAKLELRRWQQTEKLKRLMCVDLESSSVKSRSDE